MVLSIHRKVVYMQLGLFIQSAILSRAAKLKFAPDSLVAFDVVPNEEAI